MIQHHPDDNLLVEFASGGLAWGLCLLVSAHLEKCHSCKLKIQMQERIGGGLLCQLAAAEPAPDSLATLLAKIDGEAPSPATLLPQPPPAGPRQAGYPRVLNKLLHHNPAMKWQRISRGLRACRLITGQQRYEICLHHITRGQQVHQHDHGGLEITLVLQGSFSDAQGIYHAGDFVTRHPGQVHRPTASQNEDCLCLSAVEAPAQLTSIFGRLLNPFLRFRPA